ncbi:hypothetical protein [Williamsia maris]|uniref:DUF2236 domain-containing protein n=1 Tax=Williamsia maris TaxID=72806 RepID=A0ABT1HHU4_9NOCA|nr:hypothetical protein [Williamsia maris]MCP2177410.1 hypothetical protein [Williamsia maris]
MPPAPRSAVARLRLLVVATTMTLMCGVIGPAVAHAAPTPPRGEPRQCVGSTFATLGEVYDAVFDSLLPQLPAQVRRDAPAIKAQTHRTMNRLHVSLLAVSNDPRGMGASEDSPSLKYRDPVSNYIVTQLVNIRNGLSHNAISIENMTLAQAIETVWLYLSVTVFIPMKLISGTIPAIASLGPVSLGQLIALPLTLTTSIADLVYPYLREQLVGACVASVTRSEKARAGRPIKDLRFPDRVPDMLRQIADEVAIAEPGACPAIASVPLSRVVDRTVNYLEHISTDAAADRRIAARAAQLRRIMATTRVPSNLIPEDPQDFSFVEQLFAFGLGLVPTVGGTATDAIVGLIHNNSERLDFRRTIPLADLTVTKSLTAGYYSYGLATQLATLGLRQNRALTVSALQMLVPSVSREQLVQLIPNPGAVLDAPRTYGLVTFHNVLRSICLTGGADRPAGTGGR